MSFGWAIIGIGNFADRFTAEAIRQAQDAALVAVYSRDQGRGEAFAARHGNPRVYTSLEALGADPDVEAVYIASPLEVHAEHTIAMVRAGKHVLCEKPMAMTRAEAEAMVEAADAAGVRLGIGYQNRHHQAHQEARRLIAEGGIGTPRLAQAQYATGVLRPPGAPPPQLPPQFARRAPSDRPGGALLGTGVHAVDLLVYLLGEPIVEVAAFAENRPRETQVLALFRFPSGTQAVFHCGGLPSNRNDVLIYGTEGRIEEEDAVVGAHNSFAPTARVRYVRAGETVIKEFSGRSVLTRQFEEFMDAVRSHREPLCTGRDGMHIVCVTEAIYESADTGRTVRVAGFNG